MNSNGDEEETAKFGRITIPAFPMCWAVTLCLFNIFIPGFGSFLAGITVCCCGNKKDMNCKEVMFSGCMQIAIGFCQLLFTPLLLLGWIWSIIWGIAFIGQSADSTRSSNNDNTPREPPRSMVIGINITNQSRVVPMPTHPESSPKPPDYTNDLPPAYDSLYPAASGLPAPAPSDHIISQPPSYSLSPTPQTSQPEN